MRTLGLFVVALSMVFSFAVAGFASGEHPGGHGDVVVGEIVKAEGAFVTVKDDHGKSHKFHVDKSTHLKGKIKAGAKVEVEATDGGHAISMTVKE
ncbi:MAG: hypothetical protein GXO96_01045 [Nitrospirae bacterium]|nr:hypothetical protein [Candidatus Manganitrophaceae bacterium]